LTNAKDAERLVLLKEVAGTKVYEQRRHESVKIMDETEMKRTKISELLQFIESRIDELEQEKDELKQYQEADRQKRSLEYAIYVREQNEAVESLEALEDARRNELEESGQIFQKLTDQDHLIVDYENQLKSMKQEYELLTAERIDLEEDKQSNIKINAHISLSLGDIEESSAQFSNSKSQITSQIDQVELEIQSRQEELSKIMPHFDAIMLQETEATKKLSQLESDMDLLTAKQGRNDRFSSKTERDEWLKESISALEKSNEFEKENHAKALRLLGETQESLSSLEKEIQASKESQKLNEKEIDELDALFKSKRAEREEKELERKSLWREEAKLSTILDSTKEELEKSERILMGTMSKSISKGLRSVSEIVERFNIKGYHGPLYELFQVDDRFRSAVEGVAGSGLFHVVVDTDDIATRILEILNKEKGGRVTFMPLNRISIKQCTYPDSKQAIPIIKKLKYNPKFAAAISQVFGKAIIAPTLDVAAGFARSHNLVAVTLDGDRAEKKGALFGGFYDSRSSRLEASVQANIHKRKQAEVEQSLSDIKLKVQNLDQDILKLRDEMSITEGKRRKLASVTSTLVQDHLNQTDKQQRLLDLCSNYQKSLDSAETNQQNIQSHLDAHRNELGTPLRKNLSQDEQSRLERLSGLLVQYKDQLTRLLSERTSVYQIDAG
jgi:structural maintenance of chromosome 3 (chondroitin sulfate proteoglycan 6)